MRKYLRTIAVTTVSVFVLAVVPAALAVADQANPQAGADQQKAATLAPAAAAAAPVCKRQSAANTAGQDIFLSSGNYKTYTGTAWQDVDCSSTTFRLKYGERALVAADFTAEADCVGSSPTNGQWCETRMLLNGAEGSPLAPESDSFAFDSVAGGSYNWEAHAMNRAWEVRCGATAGCQYKFAVQTKMHNSTVTSMWLDEVATHIRVTIGGVAPL